MDYFPHVGVLPSFSKHLHIKFQYSQKTHICIDCLECEEHMAQQLHQYVLACTLNSNYEHDAI